MEGDTIYIINNYSLIINFKKIGTGIVIYCVM